MRRFLPVGYRFLPSEEELIIHYLLPKLLNRPLPMDEIQDSNLYGSLEPWEIWSQYRGGEETLDDDDDDDLYVFTALKKVSAGSGGSNIARQVGSNGGTWHAEMVSEGTFSDGWKTLSWMTRRFKYQSLEESMEKRKRKRKRGGGGGGMGQRNNEKWIMHEYILKEEAIPWLGLDKEAVSRLAVCRIRRKKDDTATKANKRRKKEDTANLIQLQDEEQQAGNEIIAAAHLIIQSPQPEATQTNVESSGGTDVIVLPEDEGWELGDFQDALLFSAQELLAEIE